MSNGKCQGGDPREAYSPESAEERERSLTGSSDTPSERVVSGQSSSHGSESDGSAPERVPHSQSNVALSGTMSSPNDDAEEKIAKGRRTPPGSCLEEVPTEGECSRATKLPESPKQGTGDKARKTDEDKDRFQDTASEPGQDKASSTSVLLDQALNEQGNKYVTPVSNSAEFFKEFAADLEIIELDEKAEGNLSDVYGKEKEDGDGSSSPPPAPCQPSKKLTVIVEELEQCVLPE